MEDLAGQVSLRVEGGPLWRLCHPADSTGRTPSSVILWGPPGTGKTTIAHIIAVSSERRFVELSAITAGVKDVRTAMDEAVRAQEDYGESTVLFLDEIHRFSKAQQDALLPGVENGWVILVAATTENPSFSVIAPLLSRSLVLGLSMLTNDEVQEVLSRAVVAPEGLAGTVTLPAETSEAIAELSGGDARRALTILEAAAALAQTSGGSAGDVPTVSVDDAAAAADRALVRYDREGDQHYDVVSAFIKSMRGSDPDAALHYLARMLEAGEDPRFIARRIMILASEDVGMADPRALQVAVAAAQTVQMVGLPEGRLALAEAVIYCSLAPKSNAVIRAIDAAAADVRAGGVGEVPTHLRDAHYPGAKRLGHGRGYRYPHNDPAGVLAQQYPPDQLRGRVYYTPTDHGYESEISARLQRIRAIVRGDATGDDT